MSEWNDAILLLKLLGIVAVGFAAFAYLCMSVMIRMGWRRSLRNLDISVPLLLQTLRNDAFCVGNKFEWDFCRDELSSPTIRARFGEERSRIFDEAYSEYMCQYQQHMALAGGSLENFQEV